MPKLQLKKLAEERGNAALELIAWSTLLLLPLAPALTIFEALNSQLAAESIARHALRAAVLEAGSNATPASNLGKTEAIGAAAHSSAREIAASWRIDPKNLQLRFDCAPCGPGGLVTLQVQINGALGISTMGLEPG